MRLKKFYSNLSLFWKVNALLVALLLVVVFLAEFILEPLAERMLSSIVGGLHSEHEAVIWLLSILVPSLAYGYFLSRILSRRLEQISDAAQAFANCKFQKRLPVTGNAKDPFDVLSQGFNAMADDIENHLGNERRLLADISHELRSPLTRMNIACELLQRREDPEERKKLALRLEKEITHMNELVSLLLLQGRDRLLSGGKQNPVALDALLAGLAQDFAFQGEAENKRVTFRADEELCDVCNVMGNAMALQQMFTNILSNALFYTPPDSLVEIRASVKNGQSEHVVVCVRDHGPGVPEVELENIFRAFYRVDSSRARSSGGAGLGLALVRETANAHGGKVEARNADPGLVVSVSLPLARFAA